MDNGQYTQFFAAVAACTLGDVPQSPSESMNTSTRRRIRQHRYEHWTNIGHNVNITLRTQRLTLILQDRCALHHTRLCPGHSEYLPLQPPHPLQCSPAVSAIYHDLLHSTDLNEQSIGHDPNLPRDPSAPADMSHISKI
jgi:hypothetical protein